VKFRAARGRRGEKPLRTFCYQKANRQRLVTKYQFEEVFRHINNLLTVFPEKIDKTTKIFEEAIE
jgi:hypothetical protein